MRTLAATIAFAALTRSGFALDPQTIERAKQEEQRSCLPCHSLRIVNSQRLSAAGWEKEINKMIGWGAVVSDRKLLLDYLSQEYGLTNPMPPNEMTGNAAKNETSRRPGQTR